MRMKAAKQTFFLWNILEQPGLETFTGAPDKA
jgi:hypothetical protein